MSGFNSRWLSYAPAQAKVSATPEKTTDKTDKRVEAAQSRIFRIGLKRPDKNDKRVEAAPETLPRLPRQLEALLRAASPGLLPRGAVTLEGGLVTDLSRYTLAWAASYLTGDRDEALRRLWQAQRVIGCPRAQAARDVN